MAIGTLKNTNEIEVTNSKGEVVFTTLNQGEANEKISFNLKGRAIKNKSTNIGTIKITSNDSSFLHKKPSILKKISANGELSLSLKSVVKKSVGKESLTESYLFDIIYFCREETSDLNPLEYFISSSKRNISNSFSKTTYTDSNNRVNISKGKFVKRVDFGNPIMGAKGGRRKICVYGDPGALFSLAVIKKQNSAWVSCLPKDFYNNTWDNTGVEIKDCVIDSSGEFIYYYNISKSNFKGTVYYVGILPHRDQNRDSGDTIAAHLFNNDYLDFNKTNPLDNWDGWFFKKYVQKVEAPLILRAITNSNLYKINNQRVVVRGGNQRFDKLFTKPGIYRVAYDLEVISGSNNLSSSGKTTLTPRTDITNNDNDGLVFRINNFSVNTNITGDTGNDKARIEFDFELINRSNRLISFNIHSFITVS